MRTLLKELSIQSGTDLDLLIHRAWQVHQIRGTEGEGVSRSSLLYAAATLEPLVLTLLETNGLRFSNWEQSLDFEARPQFEFVEPPADLDFEVSLETTRVAFERYVKGWPARPLDAFGVAAAIICFQLNGRTAKHLTESGFEKAGQARFRLFLDASAEGSLIRRDKVDYLLSDLSQQVMNTAVQVAREHRVRFQAITTSELFIAAFSTEAAQKPTAPAFLREWLTRDRREEFLQTYVREWMTFYDQSESEPGELPFLSQPTAAVLERARALAAEVAKRPGISARHLVGALIASYRWAATFGISDFVRDLDINPYALATAYYDYLSTAPPTFGRDNMPRWRAFLGLRDDSFLPRFNAEDVSGDDLLNVKDDVNAFATLIASTRIHPPLSIGLFGDWGSGKSFFMAKVRQKVAEYAARGLGRSDTPFHGRVVQIEFNAWHYVEANLWASLVEHLFRNLKLTHEKPDDKVIAERREELLQKLDTLLAERAKAEKKVQEAELQRDQATQQLDAQKKAAEASAALASGLRAKDVWELVDISVPERKQLQDQLEALGAGRLLKSNEDVRKTVDELRTLAGRTRLLANWVGQKPRALVLLLALLVLAPFGAQALIAWIQTIRPNFKSDIFEMVVQITSFASVALGWLARRISTGRQILVKLDAARERIDDKIGKAEADRQKSIDEADRKLADAEKEVAETKTSVQQNEKDVAEAKTALLQLTTNYRLTRFIDERAASDDYRKLLGVLATVRNDFQMLSDLMNAPPEKNPFSENSRIDRIVLYIDDLDRCPPEKVVDVLQAVHLLLAFKLFVVVVGVDARWISESLEQHHRALRAKTKSGDTIAAVETNVIGYEVRPHDYLEKIFQVPFWLERLQWEKTSRFVGSLLADDVARADARPRREPSPNDNPDEHDEQQSITTRKLHYTLGEGDAPEIDPKQLTIEEKELTYMTGEHLAALVGRSPRTAKRFVNTYRFFRASIPPLKLEGYLHDGRPAAYKCALMLLGMVVGAPDVSPDMFDLMKKAADSVKVKAFASGLPADGKYRDQWAAARGALENFDGSATLRHLKAHIARVSRFSFRAPYETAADKNEGRPSGRPHETAAG